MTIKPIDQRNQADKDYTEAMAEALKKIWKPVRPVKPDNMTREEWIMSMQSPSTQALIKKHEDPNYIADLTKPLPDNVLANPNASTKEQLIGERIITEKERSHVEAIRRRPKNSLGQSVKSSVDNIAKERGIDHFMHSPPANITKENEQRIIRKLNPLPGVVATEQLQVWVKLSWYEALVHWLKGNKVESKEDSYGHWTDYQEK